MAVNNGKSPPTAGHTAMDAAKGIPPNIHTQTSAILSLTWILKSEDKMTREEFEKLIRRYANTAVEAENNLCDEEQYVRLLIKRNIAKKEILSEFDRLTEESDGMLEQLNGMIKLLDHISKSRAMLEAENIRLTAENERLQERIAELETSESGLIAMYKQAMGDDSDA